MPMAFRWRRSPVIVLMIRWYVFCVLPSPRRGGCDVVLPGNSRLTIVGVELAEMVQVLRIDGPVPAGLRPPV
jgi:hypothetical protein